MIGARTSEHLHIDLARSYLLLGQKKSITTLDVSQFNKTLVYLTYLCLFFIL